MYKVELLYYKNLNEDEKMVAPENGYGAESACYIKVIHNDEVKVFESDAMEPEDATFTRDLNWIISALREAYQAGRYDYDQEYWDSRAGQDV